MTNDLPDSGKEADKDAGLMKSRIRFALTVTCLMGIVLVAHSITLLIIERRHFIRHTRNIQASIVFDQNPIDQQARELTQEGIRRLGGLALAVLAFIGFAAFLMAERWTGPLNALAAGLRRMVRGDWTTPVPEKGSGELRDLARDCNALAYRMTELDRLKNQLISTLSHDLRNPLSAIATAARVLQGDTLPSESRSLAEVIETSTTRLRAMVNNVLDIAQLKEGWITYDQKAFPVDKILKELTKLFSSMASESGKSLAVDFPPDLPPLDADEEKTLRIFLNLLGNAFKFTRRGDEIRLTGRAIGGWVEFCVSDTGPGIEADRLPRLFEPYGSLETGLDSRPQGTGLGLSIVRTLVEGHGGQLWLESSPGRGTAVTFTLPAAGKTRPETPTIPNHPTETARPQVRTVFSGVAYDMPLTISLAMVTDEFLPANTEVGSRVQYLAREMARRGHNVVVLTTRRKGQLSREVWNDIKVYRFFSWPLHGHYQALPSRKAIRQILLENKVDVIHYHNPGLMMLRTLDIARTLRVRSVYSVPLTINSFTQPFYMRPWRGLLSRLYVDICKRFDDIVCLTPDQARQIEFFNTTARVHVIPTPIVCIDSVAPPVEQKGRPVGEEDSVKSRPTTAEEVGTSFERLYLEGFIANTHPKVPRPHLSQTDFRLARRITCAACGRGVFDEYAENTAVASYTRSFQYEFFTVWRCEECRSIHALPKVSLDYRRSPYREIKLNPYLRKGYSHLLRLMVRQGVAPEARILIWAEYADLVRDIFHENGYNRIEVRDSLIFPQDLDAQPLGDLDALVATDVIERLENPAWAFDFAARRLRPGGLLFVNTPNAEGIKFTKAALHVWAQPFRLHLLSPRALENLSRFRYFHTRSLKPMHYLDTRWPFVNYSAMNDAALFLDGSLEAGFNFHPSQMWRKWWRIPRFFWLGLFRGWFPTSSYMFAVFEYRGKP